MNKFFLAAISLAVFFVVVTGCTESSVAQNDLDDGNYDPEARLQELGIIAVIEIILRDG